MGFFDKIIKREKVEKPSARKAEEAKEADKKTKSAEVKKPLDSAQGKKPAKKLALPSSKGAGGKPAAKDKAKKDKTAQDRPDEKKKGVTRRKTVSGEASRIILRPVFTEKAERIQAYGKYTFMVSRDANKVEVARAIRDLYGVKPVSVRVLVSKGKSVRSGRTRGRRKDEKKAVVTLPPGQIITVMESA